jgi:hypothetical protein
MTRVASRKERCFEWAIGANDARTMTHEVSAAAKSPQTTPLYVVMPSRPWGSNGEYRRRLAVWAASLFLESVVPFYRSKCAHLPEVRRLRYTPFAPCVLAQMPIKRGAVFGGFGGGFAAADTSYAIVRASFAPIHHSKHLFSFYKSLA